MKDLPQRIGFEVGGKPGHTYGQISQVKRTETNSYDAHDPMAQGFQHAFDLMFPAFVNRDLQP